MRYDPIMCMMVDDSVKTEDRDPYAYEEIKKDIQIMKSGKASYITKNGIIGRISHSFNNRVITKEQKTELMNLVMSAQDAKKVLDSAKAKDSNALDAKSLGKYKLPNGEIVDVIDRKNVHGVDTIVYKNSRGVHFATVDWFMSNAKKVYDSASALDKAIKTCDASTGHKVVVFVENYLRSIGKNNSTGKYDKIVQGVKSLLSQSLLDDEGLKKAAEHEADRLLKKYNL